MAKQSFTALSNKKVFNGFVFVWYEWNYKRAVQRERSSKTTPHSSSVKLKGTDIRVNEENQWKVTHKKVK